MVFKLKKDTVVFEPESEGHFRLNVLGYGCPHVQIYTEKALKKLDSGQQLTVVFDNPSSSESITWLCAASGDQLANRQEENGTFTWTIIKA